MRFQTYDLNSFFPGLPAAEQPVTLTAYCRENTDAIDKDRLYPAIVIFPGGGYRFTSDREAEPIALRFLSEGFQTFVVRYSVSPARYPTQLLQAAAAVAFVRKNAKEFFVDGGKIAVMGFSAGGHVAATAGTLYREPVVSETLGLSSSDCRPDALVLAYPVITSGEKAHRSSFDHLLGENADDTLLRKVSLENAVTPDTPPTFLWHTCADELVPVENSLFFASALRKCGVPFELHIFEEGVHGLSLCNRLTASDEKLRMHEPRAEGWAALASGWLTRRFSR